ncbi:D-arabinose 5-phosphate isomerase [hydrothermal vent metagenome]|uniref:D-arabinose 5-phosphate isomerase n=1 Tax=hydrothermal vent metagenome TaxID=652676 RepID=A0A3B0TCI7_9ZZZZ
MKAARPMASNPSDLADNDTLVGIALATIATEQQGLGALAQALEGPMRPSYLAAIETIAMAQGRIIVTGMGKSGHIARKIAATLASTGTPASYVHPSEASHGDLGMITPRDVVVALSWSGETGELAAIIAYSKRFAVPLIAMTSAAASSLGTAASVCLTLPQVPEACPHGLAPTTSTTMQLALGDALALSLLEQRQFTPSDFRAFHPGGSLGAQLTHVRDIMHGADRLPLATETLPVSEVLVLMTEKSFGCLGIVDDVGRLTGVVTDGDLRRHMGDGLLKRRAGDIMTRSPKCVAPDLLSVQALEIINTSSITSLFVVEDDRPVGLVHIHDLLRAGVA